MRRRILRDEAADSSTRDNGVSVDVGERRCWGGARNAGWTQTARHRESLQAAQGETKCDTVNAMDLSSPYARRAGQKKDERKRQWTGEREAWWGRKRRQGALTRKGDAMEISSRATAAAAAVGRG